VSHAQPAAEDSHRYTINVLPVVGDRSRGRPAQFNLLAYLLNGRGLRFESLLKLGDFFAAGCREVQAGSLRSPEITPRSAL
jgi:hypothetical protein